MFRDRTEPTLFRAGTVPETVPVRSLVTREFDIQKLKCQRVVES